MTDCRHCRMGPLSSKRRRHEREVTWQWRGAAGHHSGYPVDPMPYPGPERLYCFLDFMVSYQIMTNCVNLGPRPVTTSSQQCLGQLADCCQHGFRLNQFVKVPDLTTLTQEPDWACPHMYQAILSKTPDSSTEPHPVELKILKKIVSNKTLTPDEGTAAQQLLLAIDVETARGGRLVCAQSVGYVRPTSGECQYGVSGVELFFEVPSTQTREDDARRRYKYHAADVRNKYYTTREGFHHVHRIQCDTDFRGQLKVFLDQGWKLVDICYDTVTMPKVFKMKGRSLTVDTVWIFEKTVDRLADTRPRYEGVVLEYRHQVETRDGVEMPCRDWRPVIAGMGTLGWELATIVETPCVAQSALRSYSIKLLLIFQREIIASFERQRRLHDAQFPSFQQRHDKYDQIFGPPRAESGRRHDDVDRDRLPNGVVATGRTHSFSTARGARQTGPRSNTQPDDGSVDSMSHEYAPT